jgi:hypothetical protein
MRKEQWTQVIVDVLTNLKDAFPDQAVAYDFQNNTIIVRPQA